MNRNLARQLGFLVFHIRCSARRSLSPAADRLFFHPGLCFSTRSVRSTDGRDHHLPDRTRPHRLIHGDPLCK